MKDQPGTMKTLPDEVLYLVHATQVEPRTIDELQPSKMTKNIDQFPGVYFSLITKSNQETEYIYPEGKNILIFSPELLHQHNWHGNVEDKQGFISEHNTYYPWNLTEFVDKIKKQDETTTMNEIVFHDPVSMKYLCRVIKRPTIEQKIKKGMFGNSYLPNKRIKNDYPPDLSLNPFYCFPFEDDFTGIKSNGWKPSSKRFYNMMYKMCLKSPNKKIPGKKEILKTLKRNVKKIHKTRKNQKLDILYKFSTDNIRT